MTEFIQAEEIKRDRYGRPLVLPTDGSGERVAYTRCTTFVGAVDDMFGLAKWQQRMVALGLAARRDLILAVVASAPDAEEEAGKKKLDEICEQASEFAKSSSKATIGTALHALTERLDLGLPVENVPLEFLPDLAAYTEATSVLKMIQIEAGVVLDRGLPEQIHGTPDRIFEYRGKRYIGDVKTGNIEMGVGKIARQLAVYARAALYDNTTGERTPHGADLRRGLIIHLPAGQGRCDLVWVDLLAGWNGVQLCGVVREHRRAMTSKKITLAGLDAEPFVVAAGADPLPIDNLKAALLGAVDRHDLDRLWAEFARKGWNDEHTEIAKAMAARFAEVAA